MNHAPACPLFLYGASLCPVTLPSPRQGLVQSLRDSPFHPACKIHGNVSGWETSPSLLTAINTSQLVQWFLVGCAMLHKPIFKGNEAKGILSSFFPRWEDMLEKHNADALFTRRESAVLCFLSSEACSDSCCISPFPLLISWFRRAK